MLTRRNLLAAAVPLTIAGFIPAGRKPMMKLIQEDGTERLYYETTLRGWKGRQIIPLTDKWLYLDDVTFVGEGEQEMSFHTCPIRFPAGGSSNCENLPNSFGPLAFGEETSSLGALL